MSEQIPPLTAPIDGEPSRGLDAWLIVVTGVGFWVSQLSMNSGPYFIGAVIAERHLSSTVGGILYCVEMITFGLATLAASSLLTRHAPRRIAVWGALILLIGQLLSAVSPSWVLLLACRLVTGIAAALVIVSCTAIAARSNAPARIYGGANALVTVLCSGLYISAGAAGEHGGSTLIFYLLAGFTALSVPVFALMPLLPPRRQPVGEGVADTRLLHLGAGAAPLLGLLIFNAGVNAIWPFLEQLTSKAGMSIQQLASFQAIAGVLAAIGGILAGWLGTRFGRLLPIGLGLFVLGSACVALTSIASPLQFLLAETVFLASWYFVFSYILDVAAEADPTGKVASLTSAGLPLSLGLGAPIGGFLLDHYNFVTVGYVGFAATVVAFIVLAPGAAKLDRAARRAALLR